MRWAYKHYAIYFCENIQFKVLPNLVSFCQTPSSNKNSENGVVNIDQFELPEEKEMLKNSQFALPDYCFRTMNIVLKCMSYKIESVNEHKPKLNQVIKNWILDLIT